MTRLIFSLLCFILLSPALAGAAADAPEPSDLRAVAASLSMNYPSLPLKQLNPTPIDGVYEVITQLDEILYFAPATGHILIGEIWSPAGKNLTRESFNRLMTAKLDKLPLDKALKIGDGPNQVVEVSDPDCPFCREGSAFFSGRDDVTRYVFLFPLDKLHPKAEAKARFILSAEDPVEAYEDVFSGVYDDQPLPEFTDNGLLDEHRRIASSIGINSTPRYWINGTFVSGTKLQEFEKLLTKKVEEPATAEKTQE